MNLITNISDSPCQTFTLPLADGTQMTMTMAYRPQQTGWYFDLSWTGQTPAFQLNGRRIVTFPNMLRQFRNQITFGLACVTADNLEPLNQTDFSSGYANLYILDMADVGQVEMLAFPGNG